MTCNCPLLKSLWLNYTYTFKLCELSSFSLSQTTFRRALLSFDEMTAHLNYSELRMFSLNGLGENSFVQPTTPQTESVFIIQRRRGSSEIREAVFVCEKVAGMDLDIGLENVFCGECETLSSTNGCLRAVSLIVFTWMKHHMLLWCLHIRNTGGNCKCLDE